MSVTNETERLVRGTLVTVATGALVLGHTDDGRPIHAVCALDLCGTLLIVTVYEPEPPHWIDERTRGERGGA